MTEVQYKDLLSMIREMTNALIKIDFNLSENKVDKLNNVWVIRVLNVVRSACENTVEDLETDLAEKQTPPSFMEDVCKSLKLGKYAEPKQKGNDDE